MEPVLVVMVAMALGLGGFSTYQVISLIGDVQKFKRALAEARESEEKLTHTLVEVLDGDGVVRGQLMLPGQVTTSEAMKELEQAQGELDRARKDLEATRVEVEELRGQSTVLAELVDKDVVTKIRLPGKKVQPPNRTPCGRLCVHAFFAEKKSMWSCAAQRGWVVDDARPVFEDAEGQCSMFDRKAGV